MEQRTKISAAIVNVMKAVKNIEKNLKVGDGNMSYKGVSDKDVKIQVGNAMAENGLSILPIKMDIEKHVERFTDQYGKPKQQVFVEAKTTYLLLHESGESIEIVGYGHGIDSQDKAAGKATTYALKYALLYTFLVPTGSIDDADTTHSDSIQTPPVQQPIQTSSAPAKPWLNLLDKDGNPKQAVLDRVTSFFAEGSTIDELKEKVQISKADQTYIETKILS